MHHLQRIIYFHDMARFALFIISFLFLQPGTAQQVFLKLVTPAKNKTTVTTTRQFITGTTCKECTLLLNGADIKVWPTGAFAVEVNLQLGDTSFHLVATDAKGFKSTQTLFYTCQLPAKEKEVTTATVAWWRVEPQGDLLLQPGDRLQLTLKTMTGATVKLENGFELKEQPVADSTGIRGIYKGEYVVKQDDPLLTQQKKPLKAIVQFSEAQQLEVSTKSAYAMVPETPFILQTKGRLPYLLHGLGEDRLGGAKIGYLDSMVKLKAVGKVGDKYKVQLSDHRQAWIEEEHVTVLPQPVFTPSSLTGNMQAWGDSLYDYVSLSLTERLPYQTFQEVSPCRIVVDVFGATSNTNWIIQQQSLKAIEQVEYRQLEDGVFRIILELKEDQHWGHSISYQGKTLVIRVRQKPKSLLLNRLVIGVDAGHGGSNKGAFGLTGIMEKDMTLLLAKELQQQLEAEGATVLMSRTTDTTFNNHDRYNFFRDRNPDLVLSIHLNSSADPIRTKGIGLFYKHIGYRSLSQALLKELTAFGLPEYALVGNFNFLLNGFTEFPNALIETLFVSNPEEEANILNPNYRKGIAEAIVKGLKRWLEERE